MSRLYIVTVSGSLRPHGLQHARPPCPSPTPGVTQTHVSWVGGFIQPSHTLSIPFSSCLQSFPASGSFQMSQSFASGGLILEFQLKYQSFQWTFRTDFLKNGLGGSPCCPRDSQESSPPPQFKSVNSLALSNSSHLLYCAQSCPTLQPYGLQNARLPCPSPTFGACSNSCLYSWWCHPTVSSSVFPFSCLQSFPASGSFLMSQLFASSGQTIGASVSASVLPMNIQDWFFLGLTGLISLQSKGTWGVFSSTTVTDTKNM